MAAVYGQMISYGAWDAGFNYNFLPGAEQDTVSYQNGLYYLVGNPDGNGTPPDLDPAWALLIQGGGSSAPVVQFKSTNYTVLPTDNKVILTASGVAVTLPLISSVTVGQEYLIQLNNVATGTVQPNTDGSTINGLSSITLAPNYGSLLVYSTGTNWLAS